MRLHLSTAEPPPPPGLRGAIAYALALNLKEKKDVFDPEYVQILNTTTLIIVLFTIVALGGSTLPLLKVVARGLQVLPTSRDEGPG